MMLAMARIYSYQITCDISVLPGHSSKLESDCSRVRTHSSKPHDQARPKMLFQVIGRANRKALPITSCMARCRYGSSSTSRITSTFYIPGQIKFACFIRVGNLALHRADGIRYCTAAHYYIPTTTTMMSPQVITQTCLMRASYSCSIICGI